MKTIALVLVSVILTVGACKKEGAGEKDEARPAAAEKSGHAPANVKPGSHEDWCGEHAVPESQCTRCNPDARWPRSRRPATGARSTALPESQCLKCNPELKSSARRRRRE